MVKNFLSLSTVQVINTLIPLLAYPYLIRVVGVEKFGVVALAQAAVNLFSLVVEYGHNISATKKVSLMIDNRKGLSALVREVLGAKVFLITASLLGFGLTILLIPRFQAESRLFLYSALIIVSQGFLINWFFQGMQRMHHLYWLSLVSRLIFLVGSVVWVTTEEDYVLINLILGIGNLVAGVVGLSILAGQYGIRLGLSLGTIPAQLKMGLPIFLSSLTGYGSLNVNLVILGFFAPADLLGYYSLAERIYLALRNLPVLIYHTVFPKVCQLALGPFQELIDFLSKLVGVIWLVMIPVSLLTFGFAPELIWLLAGETSARAVFLLRIVAAGPMIAALNIPASQTLLAFNLDLGYLKVAAIGTVFNILTNLLIIPRLLDVGAAICLISTETFVTCYLYFYLYRYHRELSILEIFRPKMKS